MHARFGTDGNAEIPCAGCVRIGSPRGGNPQTVKEPPPPHVVSCKGIRIIGLSASSITFSVGTDQERKKKRFKKRELIRCAIYHVIEIAKKASGAVFPGGVFLCYNAVYISGMRDSARLKK